MNYVFIPAEVLVSTLTLGELDGTSVPPSDDKHTYNITSCHFFSFKLLLFPYLSISLYHSLLAFLLALFFFLYPSLSFVRCPCQIGITLRCYLSTWGLFSSLQEGKRETYFPIKQKQHPSGSVTLTLHSLTLFPSLTRTLNISHFCG